MSDYLIHHGILGQKWGVRRYQNPDGSLTDAGRKRYLELDKKTRAGSGSSFAEYWNRKNYKKRVNATKKLNAYSNKLGLDRMSDEESEIFTKIMENLRDKSVPDNNFGYHTDVSVLNDKNLINMSEAVKRSAAKYLTSSASREEVEAFTKSFLRKMASSLSFESMEYGSNVRFAINDGKIIAVVGGIR